LASRFVLLATSDLAAFGRANSAAVRAIPAKTVRLESVELSMVNPFALKWSGIDLAEAKMQNLAVARTRGLRQVPKDAGASGRFAPAPQLLALRLESMHGSG
jgi:hypothetical protein